MVGGLNRQHSMEDMRTDQNATKNYHDSASNILNVAAERYHDSWDEDSFSSHEEEDANNSMDIGDDLEEAGTYDPSAEFLPINRTKVQDIELARDLLYGSVFVHPELFPHESQLNIIRFMAEHSAFQAPTNRQDYDRDILASLSPNLVDTLNQVRQLLPLDTEWDRSTLRAIIDMLNCVKIKPPQELFNAKGDPKDFCIAEYRAHSPQIHDKDFWEDYERYLFKLFGGREKWKERVTRLQAMAFAQVESKENRHRTITPSIPSTTQKKRAAVTTEAAMVPQRKRIAFEETEERQITMVGKLPCCKPEGCLANSTETKLTDKKNSIPSSPIGHELARGENVAKKRDATKVGASTSDTCLESPRDKMHTTHEEKFAIHPEESEEPMAAAVNTADHQVTNENCKSETAIPGKTANLPTVKPSPEATTAIVKKAIASNTPDNKKVATITQQTRAQSDSARTTAEHATVLNTSGYENDRMTMLKTDGKGNMSEKATTHTIVPHTSHDEGVAMALQVAGNKVTATKKARTESVNTARHNAEPLPAAQGQNRSALIETIVMGRSPMERMIWSKYRLTFAQYNQALLDGFTPDQYRQLLDHTNEHRSAIFNNLNKSGVDDKGPKNNGQNDSTNRNTTLEGNFLK